ncbi:MAG: hypothetical protein COS85_10515 [Armatimonadetes bacterium CG07_land_8_20_14_0_80_59_28]|nr:MAG: hypothetical protein COS85_10515 [Armatimonadetes bacterium CG07_land_8_20_14_0_80_59_28]PIX38985.1 MAG: hypothetical protein COZ56_18970 [Armatimonadetes bacterium CG_4_8_14_3_um_filter_58_9]PIY44476.1 MAG: hypothetical protein COZ05_08085 [Armatimonadetes bacterium CG_4_10_14_3_um_filter_59_10]PJB63678.1 MAG: hypothetical protein CO095_16030 [Armatimonadetes bacterium CG_4_9_14_3_um_filter_58_7]
MRRPLRALSSREVLRALRNAGFGEAPRRGKGSHRAMVKTEGEMPARLVIVPQRDSLPIGTLRAIIQQAGMSVEEFLSLLEC